MKYLLIIILTCILYSCKQDKKDLETTQDVPADIMTVSLTQAQVKNAGIETGKPEMRVLHPVLKVNGLIDVPPQSMITVSFPPGGYIKSTHLMPGMAVSKGQVLAVMQDQSLIQLQQDYLMARSKIVLLQKEYDRQQLLNATKSSSDKVLEQATNELESIEISLNALKEKLLLAGINPLQLNVNSISRTVNVYSPIEGFVSSVKVNIGKFVAPTDVLFELMNTKDLHLALTIFEKDLSSIHTGQIVQAYLTSDTAKIYMARVVLISKTIDDNRSALVHCHFIGKEPKLLPGMFMNANIEVNNAQLIAVPDDAVVRYGDSSFVFIEQGKDVFKLTPVTVSVAENGYSAIISTKVDLLNETIVKKNAYAVLMKMKNKTEEE